MEPTSDQRFDTHSGVQLLLEIAREHSVEPILNKIVAYAVERTEFVFSQMWLIRKGDLCLTCKYRSECPDQSRCLHLVAGRARALPAGKPPQPYEDLNARLPLKFGPLGEAVASGELKLIRGDGKRPVLSRDSTGCTTRAFSNAAFAQLNSKEKCWARAWVLRVNTFPIRSRRGDRSLRTTSFAGNIERTEVRHSILRAMRATHLRRE
jgi:hypothetical protein